MTIGNGSRLLWGEHEALDASTGQEVYLLPGQTWVGRGAYRIRTLLGSCVAVTLWHPGQRVGGMCHYLLAGRQNRPTARNPRYAEDAMQVLIEAFSHYGCPVQELVARLFGGGHMFAPTQGRAGSDEQAVPLRNVEVGQRLVREYGMQMQPGHLGGSGHRQVVFDVQTGAVWLRHTPLKKREATALGGPLLPCPQCA
ncbi:MAG: chemotaxis protein CheD [Halothiobacillaceae bacterium]|nr:chemotaxis protein CheD [Halothiobacillaceae bacterium]